MSLPVTYFGGFVFGGFVAGEIVCGKATPGRSAGVTMEESTWTSAGSSQIAASSTNLLAVKCCPAWLLPFQVLKLQSSTTTSPIVRPRQ